MDVESELLSDPVESPEDGSEVLPDAPFDASDEPEVPASVTPALPEVLSDELESELELSAGVLLWSAEVGSDEPGVDDSLPLCVAGSGEPSVGLEQAARLPASNRAVRLRKSQFFFIRFSPFYLHAVTLLFVTFTE